MSAFAAALHIGRWCAELGTPGLVSASSGAIHSPAVVTTLVSVVLLRSPPSFLTESRPLSSPHQLLTPMSNYEEYADK